MILAEVLLLTADVLLLVAVVAFRIASQPHTGTRVAATAPAPVTALHTPRHAGCRVPAHVEIAKTHTPRHTGGYPIIRDEAA